MLDIAKGLGVGLIATAAAWFIAHNLGEMQGREEEKDRQEKVIADLRLDAQERLNEMLTSYRSMEQLANKAIKERDRVYEESEAKTDKLVKAAVSNYAADVAVLRKRLREAVASGATASPGDPGPTESQTAADFGGVLAQALRVQAELAGDAESNADAIRSLLDSWALMKQGLSPKLVKEFQNLLERTLKVQFDIAVSLDHG